MRKASRNQNRSGAGCAPPRELLSSVAVRRLIMPAALVLALPAPTRAQTAQEKARGFYEQGVAAFRAGDFATARELFERAYLLDPSPILLFNLARANEELGDAGKATEYFQMYLDREPDAPDRAEVEQRMRALKAAADRPAREKTAPATQVAAPAAESPPSLAPWAWLAFGIGAAGLGTGIAFGVKALDDEDAHHRATTGAAKARTRDDAERDALLANIGWGVAAAGAAAGVTLWLLDGRSDGPAAAPTAGGAIFGWSGAF
jgi:tetratricopeptide (TPR) repeat protein